MHTKITNIIHRFAILQRQQKRSVLLASILLIGLLLPVFAFTSVMAASQGYASTDKSITKGMAVSVVSEQTSGDKSTTYVQKSSVARANKTLGIVVDLGDNLITSVSGANQIFVSSSGEGLVYVTDLNGQVKKGDLLAPSPLEGILMRASSGTPGILGASLDDFSSQSSQTVKVSGSTTPTAKVALLHINMDVKFAASSNGVEQPFLERLGQAIVQRPVSSVQAFIALAILGLLIVVEGGIVYAAISSSILSLGRNPLAKRSIFSGLLQASLLVAVVLIVGMAAIYMVLRA